MLVGPGVTFTVLVCTGSTGAQGHGNRHADELAWTAAATVDGHQLPNHVAVPIMIAITCLINNQKRRYTMFRYFKFS